MGEYHWQRESACSTRGLLSLVWVIEREREREREGGAACSVLVLEPGDGQH